MLGVPIIAATVFLFLTVPLYGQTRQATIYFAEAQQQALRSPFISAVRWFDEALEYIRVVSRPDGTDFAYRNVRTEQDADTTYLKAELFLKAEAKGKTHKQKCGCGVKMKQEAVTKAFVGLMDATLFGDTGYVYAPVRVKSCIDIGKSEVQITIEPAQTVGFEAAQEVSYDLRQDQLVWLEMKQSTSNSSATLEVRGPHTWLFLQNDCAHPENLYLIPRLHRATHGRTSENM